MDKARIPRGRYQKGFREEAMRLVTEEGLSAGGFCTTFSAEINPGEPGKGSQERDP